MNLEIKIQSIIKKHKIPVKFNHQKAKSVIFRISENDNKFGLFYDFGYETLDDVSTYVKIIENNGLFTPYISVINCKIKNHDNYLELFEKLNITFTN